MMIGSMNNPRLDPEEEILRVSEQGFDYIEFAYEYPLSEKIDSVMVRKLIKNLGLGIIGHMSPDLPTISQYPEIRNAALERVETGIRFLKEAGANQIIFHPSLLAINITLEEKIKQNIEMLHCINNICKKHGVVSVTENLSFEILGDISFFKKLNKSFPSEICLDIGHLNVIADDLIISLENFFGTFGQKIKHLHVHDNNAITDQHLPIGCGEIEWEKVFCVAKKHNYQGSITLEVFCSAKEYLVFSKKKIEQFINSDKS